MEKAPRTRRSIERVASVRDAPSAIPCSIRWAITSVSVADVRVCPASSSSARSSAWFSMIPLWMMAMRPVQSVCGWAFSGWGSRGWPSGCARSRRRGRSAPRRVISSSLDTEFVPPAARARQMEPSATMAIPAES